MRYAVYFTWKNDGFKDSFIAADRNDRDVNIRQMLDRKEFKEISYCKIYKNGEYGKHVNVLQKEAAGDVS